MHRPILSVIIPVYNEAGTIERVLERVIDVWPEDKEIIVVDDGSQDGTAELLRQWYTQHCSVHGDCRERRNVRVMLLFHDRNRGKGSAIRTGLQYATGHYVVIQDADMEYDPADYRNLLAPLLNEEADVVYGSRRLGERMYSELNCMQKWVQIPRTWANPYYHGVQFSISLFACGFAYELPMRRPATKFFLSRCCGQWILNVRGLSSVRK